MNSMLPSGKRRGTCMICMYAMQARNSVREESKSCSRTETKCIHMCSKIPSVAIKMLSKHSRRATLRANMTRILKKTTFFCPVLPRGRPQTLQNRLQMVPEPTKIAYCSACAYQHQSFIRFGTPKAGFEREIRPPFKQLSNAFVHSASSSIFKGRP